MKAAQRDTIEELCTPLQEAVGPYLKAIIVYGSAARKESMEGSDVDVLMLLDDTRRDFDKGVYRSAKQAMKEVQEAAPDELDLHFQPPKPLSSWWDLLISGEPWAVTSMQDAQAIYDPSGYVQLTQQLLSEGEVHGSTERAQRLLKRSRSKVQETRQLLLEDVTAELLQAMTESAQAVLMYSGHPPPSPNHVADELQETFVEEEELLTQNAVDDYRSFYELTERIDHGQLTAFTAAELDTYLSQAMAFIKAMASLFDRLETQKHEDIVTTAHDQAMQLCRTALEEEGVDAPENDAETLERFKEVFVDDGKMGTEYWELLQQIVENKAALDDGTLAEKAEEDIYYSRAHLRDFESAIEDVLARESTPPFLTVEDAAEGNDADDADGPVELIKAYCDHVLDAYEDIIKAVWVLSVGDVQETEDATVVILFDDLVADDISEDDFRETVRTMTDTFEQDAAIDFHPTFYSVSEYWRLIQHGSPVTFAEIREGIPVYDPAGFFLPLKKLLDAGKIPGTKEAMQSLLMQAPKRALKVKNRHKAQILEQLYNAVVDAGQAALMIHGASPPVQKKLPAELRLHLVEDGVISDRDVDRCEHVITLWKDYEHGDIESLTGEQLDDAMDDTTKFIETVEEIMEDAAAP